MATGTKTATSDSPTNNFATNPVTSLFQGYDNFASNQLGMAAVQGSPSGGQTTSGASYKVCTDYSSLMVSLNIDIAAANVFLGNSSNKKIQLASQLQFSSYSVAVTVYAYKTTQYEATGVSCSATQPASGSDALTFFKNYGDSYVSTITKGGDYSAVFMFYAESVSEQSSVVLTLSNNGISEENELSSSFSGNIQTAMEQCGTQTSVNQAVTGIANVQLPSDVDGMINYALAFPNQTMDAAAVTSFVTQGYEDVFGTAARGVFQPVVNNRTYFLDTLSGQIADLFTLQDMIQEIQEIYEIYGYTGDQLTVTNAAINTQDITNAQNLLLQIDSDPTQSYQPGQFSSLNFGNPIANFRTARWGPHGTSSGSGLELFDDVNFVVAGRGSPPNPADIFVQQGWYLSEVQVFGGGNVADLWATYTQGLPPNTTSPNFSHGDYNDKNDQGSLPLQQGAIYGVGLWTANTVNQIIIYTSNPNNLPGGWAQPSMGAGNGSGYTFGPGQPNIPDGAYCLGFFGAAANPPTSPAFLAGLGLWYVVFSPATWSQ